MKIKTTERKSTASLEEGEAFAEDFLALLEGVFLGDELLLALGEALAEVGRLLEDDDFGGAVGGLKVGDERAEELEGVAQVDAALPLHRVVLTALLARVLAVAAARPRAPLPRTQRSALHSIH